MLVQVPHREQTQEADCLAACAAMVLEYFGEPVNYRSLLKLLAIGSYGAPRRNIVRLSHLGLEVSYREANVSLLIEILSQSIPVIAFVDTAELHYWSSITNHAVVVVGFENDSVVLNDPALDEGAKRVPVAEFELAWLNADYACAVIRPRVDAG